MKTKKVLFTATIDEHLLTFHMPFIQWFKNQGFEVHVASNGDFDIPLVDYKHNIPFERSPFKIINYKAYKQLKRLIDNNSFMLIHCHTPMGSVLTRLAAKKARRNGTKVLYTAHGFHFYKGAPIINWLLYYSIEKWLSKYTDSLITINEEDYRIAFNKNFKVEKIEKVDGVGVDFKRFHPITNDEKEFLREKFGFSQKDFILIYVAEVNQNKNQRFLIELAPELIELIPDLKIILAGEGAEMTKNKKLIAFYNLEQKVSFIGYRKDIHEWYGMADVAVSASRREGLPVNIIEAMATGLPVVVTNCRGNRDLIINGRNGFVVGIDDKKGFIKAIEQIFWSPEHIREFRRTNLELVSKYSKECILEKMEKIYLKHIE